MLTQRSDARISRAAQAVLGDAVRETRARRSLSQERLGFHARLHRNYVGAIERGEINPTFRILRKLAHGLDIPLSELIALFEQRLDEGGHVPKRGRR
jgi:transcriptional regulator with XRE-family HTH domain